MATDAPRILALDTSTQIASIALTSGTRDTGRVLACQSFTSSDSHSRRLVQMIETVLDQTSTTHQMIDGIAVCLGPGSFTGLRIAMACAKGLVLASGRPLFGFSSLDLIASSAAGIERLICVVLDARKKEVYRAFYRCDRHGRPQRVSEIAALPPDLVFEDTNEPVYVIGDAVMLYGALWQDVLGDLYQAAPIYAAAPNVAALGLLAGEDFLAGRNLDAASAVPLYIRASDATRNLSQKAGNMSVDTVLR